MLSPNGGFTKFPNRIRGVSWFNKPNTAAVYFFLRMHANHLSTAWGNQALSPGELCIGRKSLAAGTGLTENQVRTALKHLQKAGEITIKTTNQYSLISFTDKENWVVSDASPTSESIGDSPAKNQGITTVGEMDTIGDPEKDIPTHINKCACAPTYEEAVAFFTRSNLNGDPWSFWNHYEAVGWMIGKSPIVNWQAAARKWCCNGIDDGY